MPTLTLLHSHTLRAQLGQMTRLGSLIQRERADANTSAGQVLLLDAGGSSSNEVWQSAVTQGRANYLLLEALGYDAALLGEDDWQWGSAELTRLVESVHFPVLAANLHASGAATNAESLPPGVRGYLLFRMEGLNVGVVGLTQATPAPNGFEMSDPKPILEATLPILKSEGAQLIVVLSRLGLDADQQLAAQVPGLHLIIGGQPGPAYVQSVGPTLLVRADENGQSLGRVRITFNETGAVGGLTADLLPCPPTTPPEPTAAGMLDLIEFEAGVARKKTK